jgi:hypothetical protein
MMMRSREETRKILAVAVERLLDHLEDDFSEDDEVGAVVIAVELLQEEEGSTIPIYWASNENPIWQRGFFEILSDYKRLPAVSEDDE